VRQLNSRGFTLIELIVVIVIFGVLATWFTSSYFNQKEQQNLIEATTTVRSFIDNIRQSSLMGLTPASVTDLNSFAGYGLSVDINTNQISKVYVDNMVETLEQTLTLDKFKHIKLDSVDPAGTITVIFTPNKSTLVRLDGNTTTYKIILKNSVINRCSSIFISEQGVISTNDEEECV